MHAKAFLLAIAISATAISVAAAQGTATTSTGLESLDVPANGTLSGPGPITASPTRPADVPAGKRALPTRSTGLPARLLGNGTAMNYGEGGANAIGNTGGLTTGPQGSAGAVAGGGGVHSGALGIPPGSVNGAMHSDEAREHLAQPGSGVASDDQK